MKQVDGVEPYRPAKRRLTPTRPGEGVMRPGTRKDIEAMLEVIGSSAHDELYPIGVSGDLSPVRYYRRLLLLPKGIAGYRNSIVHDLDGVLTGLAVCSPLSMFDEGYLGRTLPRHVATDRWGDLSKVLNVYIVAVKLEFRRRRVVHRLFDEIMARAEREGYRYLLGQTWSSNGPSTRMAERFGFRFFFEQDVALAGMGVQTLRICDRPV